ncbi:hypothetical protein E0Z10_g7314 [Xylaria hypoxylon]|uniref:Polyprenal reductase n=1 Tax=Xylaria hypoxylon TaxID=37992 RepID=A0A4Z0YPS8_9PEZI|nr:hypothetical protein E0Z10_g7314 [Xylaria hypoxylon]
MAAMAYVCDFITGLSPAQICQVIYVLSAAAVLAVTAVPDTAHRLLTQYGARSSDNPSDLAASRSRKDTSRELDDSNTGLLFRLVSRLTSLGKVPHSWFIHFYILSLFCSVFWAVQFVTQGSVLELIVKNQLSKSISSMTLGQVILVWGLMGLQGARRLYEYLAVLRPSSSRMWIVHWLLGNVFYLCTSVSIWIEGSESIQCSGQHCLAIEFPFFKSIIASSVFLIAWFMQYRCHRHLAGLKKYSLPEDVVAAPEGQFYNQTLACAVLFVSINLGVTANGTKLWYEEKFGSKVQRKWKMIPVVF